MNFFNDEEPETQEFLPMSFYDNHSDDDEEDFARKIKKQRILPSPTAVVESTVPNAPAVVEAVASTSVAATAAQAVVEAATSQALIEAVVSAAPAVVKAAPNIPTTAHGRPLVNSNRLTIGGRYAIEKLRVIKTKYGNKILAFFPEVKYILPNKYTEEYINENLDEITPYSLIYIYNGRMDDLFGTIISTIIRKNDDDENAKFDPLCQICYDRRKNCVFLPCGHLITCVICANKIKMCCVCRKKIVKIEKVYF